MKNLKCFCNDDITCPLEQYEEQQQETGSLDILRHCSTNTVCLTKRLKRSNGTTWLKYFCDQSFLDSLRGKIIEYRDCKINSTNKYEQKQVSEQAEYCCDSHDYCNKDLNPIKSVRDTEELQQQYLPNFYSNHNSINNQQQPQPISLFTTINLVLLSSLLVFLLLTILLIFLYFIKNNKKLIKSKINKNLLNHRHHQNKQHLSYPISQQQHNNNNINHQLQQHSSSISTSSSLTSTTNSTTNTSLNSKENSYNSSYYNNNLFKQHSIDYYKKSDFEEKEKLLKTILINKTNLNNNENDDGFISNTTNTISSSSNKSSPNSSCIITTSSSSADDYHQMNNLNNNRDGLVDEWSGSGSGAGVAQLLQRTIARQIKLIYPCIGKGRFGEVYKGMWRDEYVAVKTFNSADEKSWQNECNIYNTNGFRHENILGFIAADNIDRGTYTELWIITEFHSNGSLFDFLNLNTISINELLKMSISIVNGLDHLHTPIESCTGKPALAHCDLKSKNILVKSDLTCCIGDLGLALCGDKMGNVLFKSNQSSSPIYLQESSISSDENKKIIRTGTKRDMAPEILSKTIDIKSLNEFQNAEMYSLALIFWELLRRTKFEIDKKLYIYDYKLPYYEFIQMDPDDLQMKTIVCDQKKRPEINLLWKQINIMNEIAQLTQELWLENSHARLNALRLKKSLNSILRKYLSNNCSNNLK